jgi:cyanophycinase
MCASKVADGKQRGWIIPIGGAEEKDNAPAILQRFVQLAGGERADIVVIPTASQVRDTGVRYERLFAALGAGRACAIDFDTRRDADERGRLERLQQATGVFFTGGNQLRLSTLIGGTAIAKAVRALNASGVPVAGTSAGAAFISEHMIAFGDEGSSPVAGSVRLAPGLGLTKRFILDLGLDEDTAAFIAPDNTVHVQGSGAITVVDAADVQFSSMDSIAEGKPVCLLGVKLHILTQGATFNLHTRQADAAALVQAKH